MIFTKCKMNSLLKSSTYWYKLINLKMTNKSNQAK